MRKLGVLIALAVAAATSLSTPPPATAATFAEIRPFVIDDLDGDGSDDIISGSRRTDIVVNAWSGRDGSLLWQIPTLHVAPFPAGWWRPIGQDGSTGLVHVSNLASWDGAYSESPAFLAVAWDAKGREVWRTPLLRGTGFALEALTIGDIVGTPHEDVVFMLSGDVNPIVVIDGRTGVPQVVAQRVFRGGLLAMHVVPDLSGDGRRDVLLVDGDTAATHLAPPSSWTALDGSGRVLWESSTRPIPNHSHVTKAVGDLDRDGVTEIVQATAWVGSGPAEMYLVSGRTGRTLWQGPAYGGNPVGDVNGDAWPDLSVQTVTETATATEVRLEAMRYDGRRAFSVAHVYPRPSGCCGHVQVHFESDIGDVDGDGGHDVWHRSETFDGSTAVARDAGVSGARDGVRIRDGLLSPDGALPRPLHRSVDGSGDDVARLGTCRPLYGPCVEPQILSVHDGRTGGLLFERALAPSGPVGSVLPIDIDDDAAAEILVGASATDQLTVVDDDGTVLWSSA